MVVTKWKGGRGKRRKVEEPLDALEKLLRDIRANYPSEPTGSPAAVPTTTSTGDQRVTKEAEENVNEAGQPSKGVLRGYLRSTSVWVYVRKTHKDRNVSSATSLPQLHLGKATHTLLGQFRVCVRVCVLN